MSEEGNRGAGEVRERKQKQEQVSSTPPTVHFTCLRPRDPASQPRPLLGVPPFKALPMNSTAPRPPPRSSAPSPFSKDPSDHLRTCSSLGPPLKMPSSAWDPASGSALTKPRRLLWPRPLLQDALLLAPVPRRLRFLSRRFCPRLLPHQSCHSRHHRSSCHACRS